MEITNESFFSVFLFQYFVTEEVFFFFFSNCGIVGKLRPDDPDIFHGNG